MSKQTEALKLALEALEFYYNQHGEESDGKAITAIREALAEQPAQQEPVAWRELCRRLYVELYWCDRQMMQTLDENGEPMWTQGKTVRDVLADAKAALDTPPPASKPWEGLTDEEKTEIRRETYALPLLLMEAIEAKLKEKNT